MKKHLMMLAILVLVGLSGLGQWGWAQTSSGNSASSTAKQTESHVFPLLKGKIPDKYSDHVPLPIGVSFNYVYQVMPLQLIEQSSANVQGLQIPLDETTIKPVTNSYVARFDAWVLPFLNVYATAGHFDGDAKDFKPVIPASLLQQLAQQPGMASLLQALNTLKVPYSGSSYGLGLTGAIAYERLFASYDINWNWAKPNAIETRVRVTNQGPRIGILFSPGGIHSRVYGGIYRTSLAGREFGNVTLGTGIPPIYFEVKTRAVKVWSPVLGTEVNITRHIVAGAEGSLGKTKQAVLQTGYRF